MKPHFFGDPEAPLYGVYDEPRVDTPEPLAVLACYPIAGEYLRAHRAFRQLTTLLSRKGAHVMRFDYHGTGDSMGRFEDGTLARWRSDIGSALRELQELSGAATVKVVGLRLGATLSLLATEDNSAIEHVVLWDPIVDGAEYVRELERHHVAEQEARGGSLSTEGMIGVNGFGIPRPLRDDISSIDLRKWMPPRPVRTDVVVSSEQPAWLELRDHLAELPAPGSFEITPSVGEWGEADDFGSALLPQQIIQSVVSTLTETGEPE